MVSTDFQEMLMTAREYFKQGDSKSAEPLLQHLLLANTKSPEVYQMLGTILYEKGKFNQAIKTFQRALELDPAYTDASVALSIIYNDLGKYEDGKKVFNEARKILDSKKNDLDPFISEKLARKHEELGDLYYQHKKYDEAVEQYYRAAILYNKKRPEILIRISDCHMQKGQNEKALKELSYAISQFPQFLPAYLSMGIVHYNNGNLAEALKCWERVLMRDPSNQDAIKYIKIARSRPVGQNKGAEL